jgi:hypothetical protein
MSSFQVDIKKTTVSDALRSVAPNLMDLNEAISPPLDAMHCLVDAQKVEKWAQDNGGKRIQIPKVRIVFKAAGFDPNVFGNPNLWQNFNYAVAAHVAGSDQNLNGFQQQFNCKVEFGDAGGGGDASAQPSGSADAGQDGG